MNIGKALKTCRELKQWSLVELSVFSGLAKEHLRLVEDGKRELPPASIEKVSKLFDVPIPVFTLLAMDREELEGLDRRLVNQVKELVS